MIRYYPSLCKIVMVQRKIDRQQQVINETLGLPVSALKEKILGSNNLMKL